MILFMIPNNVYFFGKIWVSSDVTLSYPCSTEWKNIRGIDFFCWNLSSKSQFYLVVHTSTAQCTICLFLNNRHMCSKSLKNYLGYILGIEIPEVEQTDVLW